MTRREEYIATVKRSDYATPRTFFTAAAEVVERLIAEGVDAQTIPFPTTLSNGEARINEPSLKLLFRGQRTVQL